MAEQFQSKGAVLVKRNPRWLALGAAPFLGVPILVVLAAVTGVWPLLVGCIHASIFGSLGLAWAYRANRDPILVRGDLRVDERGLHHGDVLLARLDEISGGFIVPKDGATVVRLERRGRTPSILLQVKDESEGRALLRALGCDATQIVGELRAASQIFGWSLPKQLAVLTPPVFLFMLFLQAVARAGGPAALAVGTPLGVACLLGWVFSMVFSSTRVRVGADGIATSWLGRQRFYPFAQIEDVHAYEERVGGKTYIGVELALRQGGKAKIPCGQKQWARLDPLELEERIREARDVHRQGGGELDPKLLARGTRSPSEWLLALRAIGAGASADLRRPAVPADKLLRVVDDASAPALSRVGAAIAAREQAPAEAKARARIAAGTTAGPALRVALERVAADEMDDAAVAEALVELEAAAEDEHAERA